MKNLSILNRAIIIIKAKEPFINWLRHLPVPDNGTTLEDINFDNATYLLPEYDMDSEREYLLEKYYETIFEDQLAECWKDSTHWPNPRTLSIFKEWFDVEFHSLVLDLVDLPLEKD